MTVLPLVLTMPRLSEKYSARYILLPEIAIPLGPLPFKAILCLMPDIKERSFIVELWEDEL